MTQGQLSNTQRGWEKVGKRAKNLSAHPASLLLLLQKSSPAQKAAAHLHKNRRSSVALARPHYEGITGGSCGGQWPLQGKSAWKQCKKQWLCCFLHEFRARESTPCTRVQTWQQQLYCDVLHFLQTFRRTRCRRRVQRESSGAPCCVALVLSCCSSTLLVSRSFSFLPPAFQGLFSWHQPSAYLRTF